MKRCMAMMMLLALCGTALSAADLPTWQLAKLEAGTLANWSAPADAAGRRFRSAEGGQTATLSVPAWWGAGFRPPEGTVYVLEVVYQDVVTNPVVFLSHGGVGKYWGLTELHRFGGTGDGQWKTAHIPCSWDLVCRKNNFKDLTDRTEFGLQSAMPLPVEAITVTVAGPAAAERYRRETREWVAHAQAAKRATASCGEKQTAVLEGEWGAKPAVPFVRTYMAALLQNAAPQRGETGRPLELRLARNEYETAGFGIYANGAALSNVEVSAADLKGPDGATLPVRLQTAEYSVVREDKQWLMWPQRFWPAYPVDIAAGQSHAFWLTVQSKAGQTKPGVYTGAVRVRSGKIEAELPVRAEVLPVLLPTMQEAGLDLGACGFPALQDLKTMAEYNHTGVDIWFGGAQQQMRVRDGKLELDSTYLDDWMRYAARHGMNHMMWFMGGDPFGFPDTMNLERDLYRAQEGENNTLRRAFLDKTNEKPDAVIPEVRDLYVQWVRQTAENAKRQGWPARLIIHPFDEPAKWVRSHKWNNAFHPVIGAGKWIRGHFEDGCALIRQGAKGFDNILTGGDMHHAEPSMVFLDDVDVFCSNAIHEDEKLGDKVRAAGVQFWQYSGCGDHTPAHGPRFAYGWYFAAYDSRGSLVWAYDSMDRFDTSEKGGWGYGWNTPFGTVETPYLIGTREGWDDRRWIEAYRKQVATKDPAARDALDGILKQAIAKRTDKGKDTVNDFYAEMAGYERMDVWRARLAEALAATLTLHPASAMVRLSGPSGIALPPKADTYTVEAAGGEVESFQVAVRRGGAGAPADAPLKVQVEIRAKPDPAADPMKQKAVSFWVSLYQVMDVNYKGPAANDTFKIPPGNEGWIPDVCLPLATSGFAVEAQAHNPGQVTLLVEVESVRQAFRPSPSDTYELTVKEAGSEFPPAILTLTLRQRKVVLPARLDFMTGVTWNWNIEKYLGRELTPVERSKFIDFFLRHRLTPASFFSRGPSFSPEELRQIAGGAPGKAEDGNAGNIFQLFHIGGGGKRLLDDKAKTDLEPKLRDWRKTMQDAGALDFCYALIGDECPPEAYPMIRANALWLKSVFPELKIWLATRPVPDLLDVVDAWDVVTAHSTGYYSAHSYTPEGQALARGAPGKPKCWWFYSVEPYGPHPNCRIDNALADSRAIGWLSFTKGMDGFEYFWATDWAMNEKLKAEPYPGKAEKWDLGLSGAGQLCYPVEVAGQCVPAASLRLVNLRDAMEDWALFRLAGNAIQKEFAGEIRDPETLAKVRQRALDLLENSQK